MRPANISIAMLICRRATRYGLLCVSACVRAGRTETERRKLSTQREPTSRNPSVELLRYLILSIHTWITVWQSDFIIMSCTVCYLKINSFFCVSLSRFLSLRSVLFIQFWMCQDLSEDTFNINTETAGIFQSQSCRHDLIERLPTDSLAAITWSPSRQALVIHVHRWSNYINSNWITN